ncbi:MAG: hypothetical protein GWO07_05585 [Candidatus Dadabacteria bacterium]|nr:hypothetical protein [Candidatus Dadabacteria bacterium]NIS08226.1 hypothetical protein [Candidatus Dadabacteria bacterium]NIV41493.1 hypothetical protein [Candidatus Dadabacteria bacterium]NIY21714.1 hypothetical protein [Candidatus Dadabacteria bacterium]
MIEYETYKVLHIAGVFFLLFSLSSYLIIVNSNTEKFRKLSAIMHGISMFIVLLGGFGLLARLGIIHGSDWPVWVWIKLVIWIVMGAMLIFIKKFHSLSKILWFTVPILAIIAAYLAVYQPV